MFNSVYIPPIPPSRAGLVFCYGSSPIRNPRSIVRGLYPLHLISSQEYYHYTPFPSLFSLPPLSYLVVLPPLPPNTLPLFHRFPPCFDVGDFPSTLPCLCPLDLAPTSRLWGFEHRCSFLSITGDFLYSSPPPSLNPPLRPLCSSPPLTPFILLPPSPLVNPIPLAPP